MSKEDRAESAMASVREVLRSDEASGSGTTFMRGLTLGALIGAAVAGSALWQRRAKSKRPVSSEDRPQLSTNGD